MPIISWFFKHGKLVASDVLSRLGNGTAQSGFLVTRSCEWDLTRLGRDWKMAVTMCWNEESPMVARKPKAERYAVWAANIASVIIAFLLIFPLLNHFV